MAHLVDDWHDKIFKYLEINVFRQALEDVGEVEARVLVCHFDEHLAKDSLAKLARLVGELLLRRRDNLGYREERVQVDE